MECRTLRKGSRELAKKFYGLVSVLYGGSNSGKTVFAVALLQMLNDFYQIPEYFIFTSTPKYYRGIPNAYISGEVETWRINQIWERQVARTHIYEQIHQSGVLPRLAARVADAGLRRQLARVRQFRAVQQSSLGAAYGAIEKEVADLENYIYREHIVRHIGTLNRLPLTEDEAICLKNIHLNPHICIAFDDVTGDLENACRSKKCKLSQMFYAGRNQNMTILVISHSGSCIPSKLRQNAHLSLFAAPENLSWHFDQKSMGFSKDTIARAQRLLADPRLYEKMHKVFFERLTGEFYRAQVDKIYTLKVGADYWLKYGRSAEKIAGSSDKNKALQEHKRLT